MSILVGTASWTDKTLLESGWYPKDADSPEKRLAHYAKQFPLVEVDSTYYTPPNERNAQLWAERTPARVHVQHQGVLAAHAAPDTHHSPLQGPAPRDRQGAALPQRSRAQGHRRGLGAVPGCAGAAARRRQARRCSLPVPAVVSHWQGQQDLHPGVPASRGALCDLCRVPQQDLALRRQPRGDARLPPLLPGAVRLRRHAAGLPVVRTTGCGGDRRPCRRTVPRAQRQVAEQRHLRAVRLQVLRQGAARVGAPRAGARRASQHRARSDEQLLPRLCAGQRPTARRPAAR